MGQIMANLIKIPENVALSISNSFLKVQLNVIFLVILELKQKISLES